MRKRFPPTAGPAADVEPLAVDIRDVPRYLPVGRSTTYRLIGAGNLETVSIGRRRLVTMRSIRALVDQLAKRASPTHAT